VPPSSTSTNRHASSGEKPTKKKHILANILRQEILDGKFAQGSMLPSEKQLVKMYGMSRTPVREAIEILRSEGLITVHHGKGAVVRLRPDRAMHIHIRGLLDEGAEGRPRYVDPDADEPRWELVNDSSDFQIMANVDLALAIGVREHTKLVVFDRLLETVHGHRMSHRLYIPRETFEILQMIGDKPFHSPAELYSILAGAGITLKARESVRARIPQPETVAALKVPHATPVLITRRVVSTDNGKPFAMEEICVGAENTELVYDLIVGRTAEESATCSLE
jgi:GntR family transcriptional regulator